MVTLSDNITFFTHLNKEYAVDTQTGSIHFVNEDKTISAALPAHPALIQVREAASAFIS